ncbi:threonine-phosphate decarboxylase CobD [Caldalkalibacillus salinus]|uniref:threonine-phosphate decarboxylase CobD n=1 Tax=Caldalkalibacillus salinus TaxID=2803787 RepID=UPI001921619E|nr:threonine-phosphate decarboxylase CobD [Caldalkalibacillus salinus]
MEWPNHGGQPAQIQALFPDKQTDVHIDFSANINPLGPPPGTKEVYEQAFEKVVTYPDPNYDKAIEAVAADAGVDASHVCLTNGGAEAIFNVLAMFKGKKATIIQPTFSEYERACQAYQLTYTYSFLDSHAHFSFPLEEVVSQLQEVDVVLVCRPNNPTGTLIPQHQMDTLIQAASKTQTTIVVDEAFIDFLPKEEALTAWLKRHSHLILLRSMTKIFSVPGLRMGYILGSPEIIQSIKSQQIPWTVNAIAAELIPFLLQQHTFIARTRQWLAEERAYLQTKLEALAFDVTPFHPNFFLLRESQAYQEISPSLAHRNEHHLMMDLFESLLSQGILARHTHYFPGIKGRALRFAVSERSNNVALIHALEKWRRHEW